MSMDLMVKAMNTLVGNPLRKLVLLKLADNANDQGECWPSYQHIADQCEISRRSVINHINSLIESGLLEKIERKGGLKNNQSNLYILKLGKAGAAHSPRGAGDSLGVVQDIHPASEGDSPCSAGAAPPPSAGAAPRTSHSFEPVIEPVIEPVCSPCSGKPNMTAATTEIVLPPEQPKVEIPADMPGPKDPKAKTFKTWANYAMTYRRRYGVWPVWNARVAGQLGNLIDRIGHDAAPKVAAYYLSISDQRFITEQHSVGLLLARAEALHTQWATGTRVNSTTARQNERTAANFEAAQTAIGRLTGEAPATGGSIYDNPFYVR